MGIVFIDGMVRVDQRCAGAESDPPCKPEGGELALGMHNVRLPVHQLLHIRMGNRQCHPGIGINKPCVMGLDVINIPLFPGIPIFR